MHLEIRTKKPGTCAVCGMKLVVENKGGQNVPHTTQDSYTPLIIIILLILVTTLVLSVHDFYKGSFHIGQSMTYFMAGFFLVFSGFKLIDVNGFAEGYRTYDLIAQKIPQYGYMYPFIELLLGLLYVARVVSPFVNICTAVLMGVSGIGVGIKIAKREKFQCACLGTFLNVPLTNVTVIEDFGMAIMALLMLLLP